MMMERKLSLQISLQRNDRLVKLIVVSVLGLLLLCYCLQILIFLLPLLYPGYNTVKVLQVLPTHLQASQLPQFPHSWTFQSDSVTERRRWLSYWLVYGSLTLTEQFLFLLAWLLPLYTTTRTVFLLWCLAPIQHNGADIVYKLLIKQNTVTQSKS